MQWPHNWYAPRDRESTETKTAATAADKCNNSRQRRRVDRRHTGRRHTLCVSAMTSTTRLLARACTHYDDSMITLPNIFLFFLRHSVFFRRRFVAVILFTVHFFFVAVVFVAAAALYCRCVFPGSPGRRALFLHKRFFAVECLLFMRGSQLFYCLVRSYLLFFARLIRKRRPLTRRWWWSSAVTATAPLSRPFFSCFSLFLCILRLETMNKKMWIIKIYLKNMLERTWKKGEF